MPQRGGGWRTVGPSASPSLGFEAGPSLGLFWEDFPIGGGGLMTGIDINRVTGLRLCRTDTFGGYVWRKNSMPPKWEQFFTQAKLPPGYSGFYPTGSASQSSVIGGQGCYEAVSAPSNDSIIYAAQAGYVFKSTDQGLTWAPTTELLTIQASAPTSVGGNTLTVSAVPPGWGFYGAQFRNLTHPTSLPLGTQYQAAAGGTSVFLTNTVQSPGISTNDVLAYGFAQNAGAAPYKLCGQKMAVDPANPDVCYIGTEYDGLFVTLDGGVTWNLVTGVPVADSPFGIGNANPAYNIVFDPSSGTTGGKTNTLYAFCFQGTTSTSTGALYCSVDAGTTWHRLSGGPSSCSHIMAAQTGGWIWLLDGAGGALGGSTSGTAQTSGYAWRYSGGLNGTWVQFTAQGGTWAGMDVNPFNADHVMLGNPNGVGTLNGTAATPSWTSPASINVPLTANNGGVPWLTWITTASCTCFQFDPTVTTAPYQIITTEGQGIWEFSTDPTNMTTLGANISLNNISQGIEQLVARHGIAPNGVLVAGFEDQGAIYLPYLGENMYPSQANNTVRNGGKFGLTTTFGLDWAGSNPNTMVCRSCFVNGAGTNDGYSLDGGMTWNSFGSTTYFQDLSQTALFNNGGNIAFNVPNVTGLTTWANGAGTILRIISYCDPGVGATFPFAVEQLANYWPITVDAVHNTITIDVQWAPIYNATGMRYILCTETNLHTDCQGLLGNCVTAVFSAPITGLGTPTGGSGYVNGNYSNVPLTGGSGTGGTANITVSGGAVTAVSLNTNPDGQFYQVGDTLSASNANLGGSGSGFSIGVTSVDTQAYLALASFAQFVVPNFGTLPCTVSGIVGTSLNGQWIGQGWGTSVCLLGSTYSPGYTSGGSITTIPLPGGCIGVDASGTTLLEVAADGDFPWYSPDFGHTWQKVAFPGIPQTAGITSAVWASGIVTLTTNINHGLNVGDFVGLDGSNLFGSYTAISPTSGTTVTVAKAGGGTVTGTTHFAGIPGNGSELGWVHSSFLCSKIIASDKVLNDTFYIWNAAFTALYQVQSGVATLLDNAGFPNAADTGFNATIASVPGKAGELFFTGGSVGNGGQGPAQNNPLVKYKVGVSGWQIPNSLVTEALVLDVGAIAPGAAYPTVAFIGWNNDLYGFWYSTDGGVTYTLSEQFPNEWLDGPVFLCLSQTAWQTAWVGTGGSSVPMWTERFQ